MTYEARLDVDLAFHSHDALATALAEAGPPPGLLQADGQRSGWPILAQLGEYAHADLHGLHLNGWIRGHLLSDFDDRLRALAQHADGTIHGIGEDDYSWHTRLAGGVVAEHREWSAPPEHPAPTRSTGHPTSGHGRTTTERLARVGRIELHVTHALPRIAAVPWIGAHLEELRPLGPEAGGITLTGVTTLDAEALQAAAPDAAWQAFCNPDTATPNRWTGHHPVTGTVEAHHVDGQIVVSRRGRAPRSTGTADHQERLTQLVRLLDLPPRGGITTPAMPTPTRAGDHLTQTWQEAPHPQAGHVPRDATITPTR
jgi:hypothetical protein